MSGYIDDIETSDDEGFLGHGEDFEAEYHAWATSLETADSPTADLVQFASVIPLVEACDGAELPF